MKKRRMKKPKAVDLKKLEQNLQWVLSNYSRESAELLRVGLNLIRECRKNNIDVVSIDEWERALGESLNSLYFGFMKTFPCPKEPIRVLPRINWDEVTIADFEDYNNESDNPNGSKT